MSTPLLRSGKAIPTVFDLMGSNENDMSSALAFALSRSQFFLSNLLASVFGIVPNGMDRSIIQVQTARASQGITDVEISSRAEFFIIIEAKRDASLPTTSQLNLYAPVIRSDPAPLKCLLTVTNATPSYAHLVLSRNCIHGISLLHRSWKEIRDFVADALPGESSVARWTLREFHLYLEGILGMENRFSNLVYVVSLASGSPNGWTLSWTEIVNLRQRYYSGG